jgi:hypothetical protein
MFPSTVVRLSLFSFLSLTVSQICPAQAPSKMTAPPLRPATPKAVEHRATKLSLMAGAARQPLAFFPIGEPSSTRFVATGSGYSLALGKTSLVLTSEIRQTTQPEKKLEASPAGGGGLSSSPGKVRIEKATVEFLGANPQVNAEGLEPSAAYANFFSGNDPAKWRQHVSGYSRVRYTGLYPGVDLIYYGETHRKLEYDLVVAPGADPQQIRFHVTSEREARIGKDGTLELDGAEGTIRLDRPVLYQSIEHGRKMIAGGFVQLAKNEFGFRTKGYDQRKPLIIDPRINLVYATYAGGIHDDQAMDLALDANGAAYVTGYTASQDFPVSGNAVQLTRMNIGTYTYDSFLMKFDASGTLVFSTFLGGSQTDQGRAVQLDSSGNIYLAGYTQSPDFPTSVNALQKTFGGDSDAFFAKLSNDGSQLIYSTYLGGAGGEAANRMRVNADGTFWLVGDASADGLPVSATAVQPKTKGSADGFVAKMLFTPNGDLQIPYLTYLGGSNNYGQRGLIGDLDVDASGNVYVTGATQSADFPVTADAFEKPFPLSGGCYNSSVPNEVGFITKFNPDLSKMLYSTVVGGHIENQNGYPVCNQYAKTIHVDASGNMWLVGSTGMSDFPTTANAISRSLNGNNSAGVDTFVFELSADGTTQLYGTYLGGSQFDYGGAAAWDANGNIWIAGPTQSLNYPVTSDALQPQNAGGYDTFVTELSPDGARILYATYLGGAGDDDISSGNRLRVDVQGNIRLAGETASANYPVTPTASQSVFANGDQGPDGPDAYYAILGTGAIGTVGPTIGGDAGDSSLTVNGAGFQAGATCSLVAGGVTIKASQATVNAGGTTVNCTFALNGATNTSYDVVVTNLDGTTFTKPSSFTVQKATGAQLWANVLGRPAVRAGTPSNFVISYGNSGNTDAYFTTLWVGLSPGLKFTLPDGVKDPFNPSLTYSDQQAAHVASDGSVQMPFILPHIPAGGSGQLVLQITDPTIGDSFGVQAYTTNPWFTTYEQAASALHAAEAITAPVSGTCASLPAVNASSVDSCLNYWLNYVANGAVSGTATRIGTVNPPFDQAAALLQSEQGLASSFEAALNQSLGTPIVATSTPANIKAAASRALSLTQILKPMGDVIQFPVKISPEVGVRGLAALSASDLIVGGALMWGMGKILDYDYNSIVGTLNGDACTALGRGSSNSPPTTTVTPVPCPPGGTQNINLTFHCSGGDQVYQSDIKCQQPPPPGGCPPKPKPNFKPGEFPLTGTSNLLRPNASGGSGGGGGCGSGSSGGAIDPNYKSGSVGDGSASHYVTGLTPFTYIVGFENEPAATLPASQVVVTDQLDPTKVDLATLTLGQIQFGTNVINLPPGTSIYNTTYNLSPTLHVRIAGSLDKASGLLKWTFTSIDPSTGLPPSDPTVGFLPPDSDGIVGQGSVLFNVTPRGSQGTGTVITNQASIVFDTNAAIATPTWTNTIDSSTPTSTVTALAPKIVAGSFPVGWSGTDTGSGIATYTVYVSDNGGPFTIWQPAVTTTTANYTGVAGHTYGFYSIATDGAGNIEPDKTGPDTTTAVVTSLTPLATTTTLSASSTTAVAGSSVTLTALVSAPAGTTAIPAGTVTFFSGTTLLGTVSLDGTGKAVLSTTALPTGADSVTALYGGSGSFSGSTSPALSIVVGVPSFAAAFNPSSLTVTSGGSASSVLTVTPMFGFSSAITLKCSGLPANSTCSFSPSTITPTTGAVTSTITIATGVTVSAKMERPGSSVPSLAVGALLSILFLPFGMAGLRRSRTIGRAIRLCVLLLAAGALTAFSGCGGSSTPAAPSTTKTPTGTSTITVTATAGSVSQTTNLQLTVN